ncbi:alkylhydroperoxidase [Opitutaceae bacterium EW11]|nr:alkylhydroperoxidase [Opitutaceae bacterium EW11]
MNTIESETMTTNQPRLNYRTASPVVMPAMLGLQQAVNNSGLEKSLLELVKLRTSLINRCAFCIDMHFREAKADGETEQRLLLLSAWEEVDLYTPRERAALRWTDALTRLSQDGVSDETFEAAHAEFSDAELAALTLAIVAINGWNRFSVGFRVPPGFRG